MLSKRGGGALQSRSFEHLCLSMLTSLRENAQCKGKGRARFIVYQIDSTISLEKVGEDLPQKNTFYFVHINWNFTDFVIKCRLLVSKTKLSSPILENFDCETQLICPFDSVSNCKVTPLKWWLDIAAAIVSLGNWWNIFCDQTQMWIMTEDSQINTKTAFTGQNWKLRNKRRTFQSVKGQQLRNRNVSLTKRWPLHASWSQVWFLNRRCVAADLATSLRCSVFVNILPSDKFARNNCNVYKDQHVSRVIADTFLAEWCMSVSLLILQKKLSRSELQGIGSNRRTFEKKTTVKSEQCYKCLS